MQEEIVSTTEERTEPSDRVVEAESEAVAQDGGGAGGADRDAVVEALKNVYDPELGLNIVDLGLVYEIDVHQDGGIDIQYSLTTMGCPIGPMIEDQMRSFLRGVPGVGEVRPEFVLRPPWTPEMMSDEAKAALGIF